ncbi:MAG TPA: 30S ribosomal protein S21 [Planctomycetota bacterium]|nr:30S ribosomal protein S21 [Planctomycetota bacterium]
MVIRVQTRDNEPVDKALRRLRKLCNNEGLTRTTKSKAFFEKPSEQRRREARERLKAIRLACRAKENDAQKLLNRRRKARKTAKGPREGGAPGETRPSGRGPGRPSGGGMRRSPMAVGVGGADSLAGA